MLSVTWGWKVRWAGIWNTKHGTRKMGHETWDTEDSGRRRGGGIDSDLVANPRGVWVWVGGSTSSSRLWRRCFKLAWVAGSKSTVADHRSRVTSSRWRAQHVDLELAVLVHV